MRITLQKDQGHQTRHYMCNLTLCISLVEILFLDGVPIRFGECKCIPEPCLRLLRSEIRLMACALGVLRVK